MSNVKVNGPTQFLDVGGTQMATDMYNKNKDKFSERMKKNTDGKVRISVKEFLKGMSEEGQPKPKAKEEKEEVVLEDKKEDNDKEETVQETKEKVKEEKKPAKKTTKKSGWGKK